MLIFNHFSRITILRLTLFFVVCLVAVSSVYWWALPQISQQEKKAELLQFREIAPQIAIQDSVLDTAESVMIGSYPCTVYRIYQDNTVMAYFIKATTNKGYSGNIDLLIGISADRQEILGVRVLKHYETPGLGDKIEKRISNWIDVFNHYPVLNNGLAVKKDGGQIDQFTGATITPRAVTNLVAVIAKRWQERGAEIE